MFLYFIVYSLVLVTYFLIKSLLRRFFLQISGLDLEDFLLFNLTIWNLDPEIQTAVDMCALLVILHFFLYNVVGSPKLVYK